MLESLQIETTLKLMQINRFFTKIGKLPFFNFSPENHFLIAVHLPIDAIRSLFALHCIWLYFQPSEIKNLPNNAPISKKSEEATKVLSVE